jgi:hypothetical protein
MKGTKKKTVSTKGRQPQTRNQAFLKACTMGDLRAQVQIARAEARELIWVHGIDEDQLETIAQLAGEHLSAIGQDGWFDYCAHLSAAFALGIAIGQLVSPDLFKSGGVR